MSTLQEWMKAEKLSDSAVAERIGVSRVSVLRYRLGQSRPEPDTAEKLEQLTGIPWHEFIRPSEAA
jgi:transcriptional regulator with XRE-family HTH domain